MARDGPLGQAMLAMRAACRKYLEEADGIGEDEHDPDEGGARRRMWGRRTAFHSLDPLEGMVFMSALGELRGVFGVHIARISSAYGIDVEDTLATILPANPDSEESEATDKGVKRRQR